MLRAVCTFSAHELSGQLNRIFMVFLLCNIEITSCVYTKTIIIFILGEKRQNIHLDLKRMIVNLINLV